MIYPATTYEVHYGVSEPTHDNIHPDISSSKGVRVSGPHRTWKAAAAALARTRRLLCGFAWITFAGHK